MAIPFKYHNGCCFGLLTAVKDQEERLSKLLLSRRRLSRTELRDTKRRSSYGLSVL